MKKVLGVFPAAGPHWVGDGFHVRPLFSYNDLAVHISPFLMLDYGAPKAYPPAERPRGVGSHPHRGFETVTIAYQGEVEHRDSTGQGGLIGPGDVQWMTAGAGIVHEEFHSHAFTRAGGTLEMAQLWVNLPRASKMTPAAYQAITSAQIPAVTLPEQAGTLRVIAGSWDGHTGPATTHSPIDLWDLRLQGGRSAHLRLPAGHTAALALLAGRVRVAGTEASGPCLVILEREPEHFQIEALDDAQILVLSGQPLDEPIVGYGPFVMNSREEIITAINDFNSGRFGRIE